MLKTNQLSTPEYNSPSCKTIHLSLERTILGDSTGVPNFDSTKIDDESDDWK